MKLQFYYVKDKDGRTFLAFRKSGKYDPPIKASCIDEWVSPRGTSYYWFNMEEDDNKSYPVELIIKIITDSLNTLPGPSWEDEFPMLVTLDLQCTNVNYSYIEQ